MLLKPYSPPLKSVKRTTISSIINRHRTQGLTHLLGGQGRHVWLIVRQLSMKAGWWDASLTLWDLAVSNLYVHSLPFGAQNPVSRIQRPESSVQDPAFRVKRPESSIQSPASRVQCPESSVQRLRPEPRNSGMSFNSLFSFWKVLLNKFQW